MKYTVNVSTDSIIYVEKLFYELNSYKSILNYIINVIENDKKDLLSDYIQMAIDKDIELEMAKKYTSQLYLPKELEGCNYNYSFNFDNEEIIYEKLETN